MAGFCTVAQVFEFLPNLVQDFTGDPSVSTTVIQIRIDSIAAKIRSIATKYGLTLPGSAESTAIYYLLELLNIEQVVAQIFLQRSTVDDPILRRQAETQFRFATNRFKLFEIGQLSHAWLVSTPLSTTRLASVDDCEIDTPGFNADTTHKPVITTIERWIDRETAFIRTLASRKGYAQSSLTTSQADLYKTLVSLPVRAYVLRARSRYQYGPALDTAVNSLLDIAEQERTKFQTNKYTHLFV